MKEHEQEEEEETSENDPEYNLVKEVVLNMELNNSFARGAMYQVRNQVLTNQTRFAVCSDKVSWEQARFGFA